MLEERFLNHILTLNNFKLREYISEITKHMAGMDDRSIVREGDAA